MKGTPLARQHRVDPVFTGRTRVFAGSSREVRVWGTGTWEKPPND